MNGKTLLLALVLVAACANVSSKGLGGRFKFLFPPAPPPPPPGCLHRGSFYRVGEVFTNKWCSEYCTCREAGVTVCRSLCAVEWVECDEGLEAEVEYEPVLDGRCSCPRHVCVAKD